MCPTHLIPSATSGPSRNREEEQMPNPLSCRLSRPQPRTAWLLLTYRRSFCFWEERTARHCQLPSALRQTTQLLCTPLARNVILSSLHLANSYLRFRLHLKYHVPRKVFPDLTGHPLPFALADSTVSPRPVNVLCH